MTKKELIMKTKVKLESFKEALSHFLELCDDLQPESVVEIFSKLKENGIVEHVNEMEYWCGNHYNGQLTVRLYMVEQPLRFYVVESSWWENSDNTHRSTKRWVYVPEE